MLEKHKVYMRTNSDNIYEKLSEIEVKERLDSLGELQSRDEHLEEKEMRENFKRTTGTYLSGFITQLLPIINI